jgi:hypothetical protein
MQTALMFASRAGNAFLIDFLVANEAKINAQDDHDWTVKRLSALFPFSLIVSKLFLSLLNIKEPFTREQSR